VTASTILIVGLFASPKGPPGSPPPTLTPSARADLQRCLSALKILSATTYSALECFDGIAKLAELVSPGITISLTPVSSQSASATNFSGATAASAGKRAAADESEWSDLDASAVKLPKLTNLPFSTNDLSSSTFDGYSTFSFDLEGSFPTPPMPDSFSSAGYSNQSFDPSSLFPNIDTSAFALPTPPTYLNTLPPASNPSSHPVPTAYFANDVASTNFWSLPFSAPPPGFDESFSSLLAGFETLEGVRGGGASTSGRETGGARTEYEGGVYGAFSFLLPRSAFPLSFNVVALVPSPSARRLPLPKLPRTTLTKDALIDRFLLLADPNLFGGFSPFRPPTTLEKDE
jgi:hypothetical protein